MKSTTTLPRQQGAVIVTVAVLLLFLLGFMGVALDFGRLFIVKGELQTAMDSCALAAAQELDGSSTAISRAQSAGMSAGNLNRVDLQSENWSAKGQLVNASITFRDQTFAITTGPDIARYAECRHVHPEVQLWLLRALAAFSGSNTVVPNTLNVAAVATATRGSAQSVCPIPVKLKPKKDGVPPDYGFEVGEWVEIVEGQPERGEVGWASLTEKTGANDLIKQLNGECGVRLNDPTIEIAKGGKDALKDAWNLRFGIYKKLPGEAEMRLSPPDQTGFAYTALNWPNQANAYNGTPGGTATTANFLSNRAAYASFASLPSCGRTLDACAVAIGLSLNGFKDVAPGGPSAADGHREYGTNRRIVTVPIVADGSNSVSDFACMLMLQPFSTPSKPSIYLEFLGNASSGSSPCVTSGVPGGSSGPLVPVLVR